MQVFHSFPQNLPRICLVAALLMATAASLATEYYVNPEGDDSATGTAENPWQTIGKAAATLQPGDTVYLMNGVYRERLAPARSGLPGQPIVYTVFPDHRAIIDGTGVPLAERGGILGLVDIGGKSHLRISGLHIVNATGKMDAGIFAAGSEHIVLENNCIANTGTSGICTWKCRDVVIAGNRIESVCTGGVNECISLMYTDTFDVRENYVHNAPPCPVVLKNRVRRKEGIDAKDGSCNGRIRGNHVHHTSLGIYVDARGSAHDIEITGNLVHDIFNGFATPDGDGTGDGIVIASETEGTLANIAICNNIIYNALYGIRLAGYGSPGQPPATGLVVANNTLHRTRRAIELSNRKATDVVIRNNICSESREFAIGIFKRTWTDPPSLALEDPTLSIDHNLIDHRGADGTPWEKDNTYGKALFANPAAGDFRLCEGSAAIDQGSATGAPDVDYDGTLRPQGEGIDIGALEKQPETK